MKDHCSLQVSQAQLQAKLSKMAENRLDDLPHFSKIICVEDYLAVIDQTIILIKQLKQDHLITTPFMKKFVIVIVLMQRLLALPLYK